MGCQFPKSDGTFILLSGKERWNVCFTVWEREMERLFYYLGKNDETLIILLSGKEYWNVNFTIWERVMELSFNF